VLLTLCALAPPILAAPAYAPEEAIAAGPGQQSAPQYDRTGGTWSVVWEDNATGEWNLGWAPYNLTWPAALPAFAGAQRDPAVSGSWVVYEDDRNGNWDIYAYDASAQPAPPAEPVEVALTTGPADQVDPAIYGTTVVYADNTNGNWDICAYDLATGVERRFISNTSQQIEPSIEGSKVVFADNRNGNWDIYCYDLSTRALKRLTTNTASQRSPQIGAGRVVYQDRRNGNWDIYMYTLATGIERRLTTSTYKQTAPSIGRGRSVVFQDDRNGPSDIYLYDLKSNTGKRVTNDPAGQTAPTILGNEVVWSDARTDEGDIYGCELLYPAFSFAGPDETPAYDSSVTFNGTLAFPDRCPTSSCLVEITARGVTRLVPVSDDGSGFGTFSFTLNHVVRKVAVRARYRGDATHLSSEIRTVTVTPPALLTRPSLTIVKRPVFLGPIVFECAAAGVLKPRHPAGSSAIRLQIWRTNLSGEWLLSKTLTLKVSDYGDYSRYRAVFSVSGPSRCKVRAIHEDADHLKTVSAFSPIVSLY
jgi:beta propeller repeat protein